MKVYISVDFEGVAGSTSWSSTNLGNLEHGPMAREMTLEAAAACRGSPGSRCNRNLHKGCP